jgi:hypothetical protein
MANWMYRTLYTLVLRSLAVKSFHVLDKISLPLDSNELRARGDVCTASDISRVT